MTDLPTAARPGRYVLPGWGDRPGAEIGFLCALLAPFAARCKLGRPAACRPRAGCPPSAGLAPISDCASAADMPTSCNIALMYCDVPAALDPAVFIPRMVLKECSATLRFAMTDRTFRYSSWFAATSKVLGAIRVKTSCENRLEASAMTSSSSAVNWSSEKLMFNVCGKAMVRA